MIGAALLDKGWTDTEVAEFMSTAASLVSAKEAGFNLVKLRSTSIAEGQSIKDPKGVLWVRRGKFLVSEDGRKVKI